jgi:NTP pyrophosphatase (non-canonical NTP hydrolase)
MKNQEMYYLYHIPGKKVGVTRNLNNRVTQQQGYEVTEYEVLDSSQDIDYISRREIELQKSYGYNVDRKPYNKLFNKMRINATEQTSTFPFPLNKLKGNLMDNIGLTWETEHGKFELNLDTVKWIMKNAAPSMYNDARTFVYNKALAAYNDVVSKIPTDTPNLVTGALQDLKTRMKQQANKGLVDRALNPNIFDNIRSWAKKRGLYKKGDTKTQYIKLQEETGELAKAILNKDKGEIVDAIGDIVVVLTNLAHLEGVNIEHCIGEAYAVIANRTGEMVNGTFVKDGK